MQSLIDLADDKFGGGNHGKDKVRILSVYFIFKNLTKANYLTSNTKNAFNFLRYLFI